MDIEAECVWPARALLGECPRWDPRSCRLLWVDIKAPALHAYRPDRGERRSWQLSEPIYSLDLPPRGWSPPNRLKGDPFVGCTGGGLSWIGIAEHAIEFVLLAAPERDQSENRFNDGCAGPDGRYWAGSMHEPEELSTGSLYAFRSDGSHKVLDAGYRVSNGPAFSPDGSVAYHADSARQEIYAFDLASDGTLAHKRRLVLFAEGEGHPDGMTTDNDGNIWVAMWDGARVQKLSAAGDDLGAVQVPTDRPTSCTFADLECTEMFITSASSGLADPGQLAGALFRARLG